MLDNAPPIDVLRPRSVAQILGAALSLYRRYPVLFLVLALVVTAPYELIVLAALGTAPIGGHSNNASTALVLVLVDVALVGPLISALYAHAVVLIARNERPRLTTVVSRVWSVLAVVVAAQIVAGIGIGVGLLAFVVPGVYLWIRWAVVAQAAALEHTDWMGALRRSGELVRGNYLHVFGLVVVTTAVNLGLSEAAGAISRGSKTTATDVIVGIAVGTLIRSFAALTTALLYFDLLARETPAGWAATPTDGSPPPD
jgi:hypothetical protein